MKKLILFTAMTLLILTACNKKADESVVETATANEAVTTVTENATAKVVAPVVDAAKEEVKAEATKAE